MIKFTFNYLSNVQVNPLFHLTIKYIQNPCRFGIGENPFNYVIYNEESRERVHALIPINMSKYSMKRVLDKNWDVI